MADEGIFIRPYSNRKVTWWDFLGYGLRGRWREMREKPKRWFKAGGDSYRKEKQESVSSASPMPAFLDCFTDSFQHLMPPSSACARKIAIVSAQSDWLEKSQRIRPLDQHRCLYELYIDVNADSLKSVVCEWKHSFSALSVKTQVQNWSWSIGLSNHHNTQGKTINK